MPKASTAQPISRSPGLKAGPHLGQGATGAASDSPERAGGGWVRVAQREAGMEVTVDEGRLTDPAAHSSAPPLYDGPAPLKPLT